MEKEGVKPKVNLEEVEPLDIDFVVGYVNNFILRNVEFFNHFTRICENKIYEVAKRTQRLEISVALLEAKLESIPEIGPASSGVQSSKVVLEATPAAEAGTETISTHTTTATEQSGGEEVHQEEAAAPEVETGPMKWKDDPRYASFFKLMRVGVSPMQLRSKVVDEGLNPEALENPEGISDYNAASVTVEADSDTDSSMSSDMG